MIALYKTYKTILDRKKSMQTAEDHKKWPIKKSYLTLRCTCSANVDTFYNSLFHYKWHV